MLPDPVSRQLRSAENVGNIFRAAEAARLEHVFCCGITPVPPHPRLLKTALGAAEHVRHTHAPSTLRLVRKLRSQGVTVWAAETTSRAQLYTASPMPAPLALVLGNERTGVDTRVLEEADAVVALPMLGVKNSLNVATACSVLLWEALRQWGGAPPSAFSGAGRAEAREPVPRPSGERPPSSPARGASRPSRRTSG